MIRSFTISLAFLFIAAFTFAQTEQPVDKATIAKVQKYYNNNLPDSLYKIFDPIMQSALPADKIKLLFEQMKAQLGAIKQTTFVQYTSGSAIYKGEFANDVLLISISTNNLKQLNALYFKPYVLPPADKPGSALSATAKAVATTAVDPTLTETPLTIKTLAGTLSGTLTVPNDAKGKIPVVLIIAGSGPTDRDGNGGAGLNGNTYKYIAQGLAHAGIACARYDKRGIGKSTSSAKEVDSKFTDFVDDASSVMFKLREDDRFSKFIIMGHSEGSLIGMITAYSEPVNALISVAGPGSPADMIIKEQLKSSPPAVQDEFKAIVDSLKKGKKTPRVDPSLYGIARPSIQNYLMTWIPYDPARVIKKIKTNILIIQGTTDIQVPVAEAEKLKKAKSEATLKIIDGMNHILKAAPADREKNTATYTDPTLPIKPEFMTAVVDFIKGLK